MHVDWLKKPYEAQVKSGEIYKSANLSCIKAVDQKPNF